MAVQESTAELQSIAEKQRDHHDLPLVLVHRLPASFDIPVLTRLLQTHFMVLDPHRSANSSHAHQSVRSLVVYGPSPLTADTIQLLPSLELVVATSAGVDHIDISECHLRHITVTNAGDAFYDDVADCALALLIAVLRRLTAADRYLRSRSWRLKGEEYPLGSCWCKTQTNQSSPKCASVPLRT